MDVSGEGVRGGMGKGVHNSVFAQWIAGKARW